MNHFQTKYIIVDHRNYHRPYYVSNEGTWSSKKIDITDFMFFDSEKEAKEYCKTHFRLRKLLKMDEREPEIKSIKILKNVYFHDIGFHGEIPENKKHTIALELLGKWSFLVSESFHKKHKMVSSSWQEVEYKKYKQYSVLVIKENNEA